MKYSFGAAKQYSKNHFGIDEYGCGLCQTGVPCESQNPVHVPVKEKDPVKNKPSH